MNVEYSNSFEKQFDDIRDATLKNEIVQCIQNIIDAPTIKDISNIKKMKGYKTAYRVRTGSYRIGVIIEGNSATISAVLHRKEIYRRFP